MTADDICIIPSHETSVEFCEDSTEVTRTRELLERLGQLYELAGVAPALDNKSLLSLEEHAARIEVGMTLTPMKRDELEKSTRQQSSCPRWHAEHSGRITASLAHKALTGASSTYRIS